MVIMFLISATCCLSSLGAIFFCSNHVVDLKHRLRADRLIVRDKKAPGFVGKRVNAASAKVRGLLNSGLPYVEAFQVIEKDSI